MPCYYPWEPSPQLGLKPGIKLPCSKCLGCNLERSRQWAIRCLHEKQLHNESCYVTLTYADDKLPPGATLRHSDYQAFMKRLRQHFKRRGTKNIRFYMAGEYGESTGRPHYHALLFGCDFADKQPFKKNANGDQLYKSATLEFLWRHGQTNVGAVTLQSAAYIARYVMKKVTGDRAKTHYTFIDNQGVIHSLAPDYNRMSNRPGIGAAWFSNYHKDVYPADEVITNGHRAKPPRYYDKLLARMDAPTLKRIQHRRDIQRIQRIPENTPRRLKAKETVQAARIRTLKRTLD